MKDFKRYYNKEYLAEKKMFVNLDQKKGGQTLGHVDTTDEEYSDLLQQIKNRLARNFIHDYIEDLLQANNLKQKHFDTVQPLFFRYFKGETKDLDKLAALKPYELPYKSEKAVDLAGVKNHYSEFFMNEFFDKMVHLQLPDKPSIGSGEAYLSLFTQLTVPTGPSGGDLIDGDDDVEVKAQMGRFGGQRNIYQNGVEAMRRIEKLLPGLAFTTKTFSKGTANQLMKHLKNNPALLEDKDLMKELIQGFANYFIMKDLTGPMVERFIDTVENGDIRKFVGYITAIHMYGYALDEGFDYILFFNKPMTKVRALNTKQINFKKMHEFAENYLMSTIAWSNNAADKGGASVTYNGA